MSKGAVKERKLIAVPGELVRELNEVANRAGVPFYEFTVEALGQAVRASRMKRTLREVVDFCELMEVQRAAGFVVAPKEVLNYCVQRLYLAEGEQLRKMWMGVGEWYGKYLQARLRGEDVVESFGRLMRVSRWDLDEFELKKEDDTVTLRCVSFALSVEDTELLMSFVEGAMGSLGYEVKERDYVKGIVSMKFICKKV